MYCKKREIRLVCKEGYRSSSTPLFLKFKTLKLQDLIDTEVSKILFKAYKKDLPQNLQKLFIKGQESHSHNTRNKKDFKHMKYTTIFKSHTLSVYGPKLWTSIPIDIKLSKSLITFKTRMKRVFMEKYK